MRRSSSASRNEKLIRADLFAIAIPADCRSRSAATRAISKTRSTGRDDAPDGSKALASDSQGKNIARSSSGCLRPPAANLPRRGTSLQPILRVPKHRSTSRLRRAPIVGGVARKCANTRLFVVKGPVLPHKPPSSHQGSDGHIQGSANSSVLSKTLSFGCAVATERSAGGFCDAGGVSLGNGPSVRTPFASRKAAEAIYPDGRVCVGYGTESHKGVAWETTAR